MNVLFVNMQARQPYAKYRQLKIMEHNTTKHNIIKITIRIRISEEQNGKARQKDL
jgi:hypothetical protein